MNRSIAVIIPVYNAENYLQRCLESCLIQTDLNEIIIIDDGSTDSSSDIIREFESRDERIKVLNHEDNENHGRSSSRNLGIKHAQSKWITFCDADDYYRKNRFQAFAKKENHECDGYYELVESEFEDMSISPDPASVTGVEDLVPPEKLFDFLITNREQRISLIGLIVSKKKIDEVGVFDDSLEVAEDTDFIWRLTSVATLCKLETESPVIVRGVHDKNTFGDEDLVRSSRLKFYALWKERLADLKISDDAKRRINSSFRYYQYLHRLQNAHGLKKWLLYCKFQLGLSLK